MIKEKQETKGDIRNTAYKTVVDMVFGKTGIPNAKKVLREIYLMAKDFVGRKSTGKAYFVESRYKGSERLIQEKGIKQVIELGAGFSPHALNLQANVENYIEVDLPRNSQNKERIIKKIAPDLKVYYVGGDIFKEDTWKSIESKLIGTPTTIFGEGFMQYTDPEQRAFLAVQIKRILNRTGGLWFFEDSLTFHTEFAQNQEIRAMSEMMVQKSGNSQLLQHISQKSLENELRNYGFKVERIPAPTDLETPELDELGKRTLKQFKHWVLTPKEKNGN